MLLPQSLLQILHVCRQSSIIDAYQVDILLCITQKLNKIYKKNLHPNALTVTSKTHRDITKPISLHALNTHR